MKQRRQRSSSKNKGQVILKKTSKTTRKSQTKKQKEKARRNTSKKEYMPKALKQKKTSEKKAKQQKKLTKRNVVTFQKPKKKTKIRIDTPRPKGRVKFVSKERKRLHTPNRETLDKKKRLIIPRHSGQTPQNLVNKTKIKKKGYTMLGSGSKINPIKFAPAIPDVPRPARRMKPKLQQYRTLVPPTPTFQKHQTFKMTPNSLHLKPKRKAIPQKRKRAFESEFPAPPRKKRKLKSLQFSDSESSDSEYEPTYEPPQQVKKKKTRKKKIIDFHDSKEWDKPDGGRSWLDKEPPPDDWLRDTIQKLDTLTMIDEYMKGCGQIYEENDLLQGETCDLPYILTEVSCYKYRRTMMQMKAKSDLLPGKPEIAIDALHCLRPLKSRLHKTKVKIPLGLWEIPNTNLNSEFCVLSHVKHIDHAIRSYILNVGTHMKQNATQRTVRDAFRRTVFDPWNIEGALKTKCTCEQQGICDFCKPKPKITKNSKQKTLLEYFTPSKSSIFTSPVQNKLPSLEEMKKDWEEFDARRGYFTPKIKKVPEHLLLSPFLVSPIFGNQTQNFVPTQEERRNDMEIFKKPKSRKKSVKICDSSDEEISKKPKSRKKRIKAWKEGQMDGFKAIMEGDGWGKHKRKRRKVGKKRKVIRASDPTPPQQVKQCRLVLSRKK